MRVLATTAIEGSWGIDEDLVFLGEWCRVYGREGWKSRNIEVLPYHWDDRQKLRCDYSYLSGLHGRALRVLGQVLGASHRLDRPASFWQFMLDPWLLTYIGVLFDRWETIRNVGVLGEPFHTVTLEGTAWPRPPFGYDEANEQFMSDTWNHELFAKIIAHMSGSPVRVVSNREMLCRSQDYPYEVFARPRMRGRRRWLDAVLRRSGGRGGSVLFQTYLPGRHSLALPLLLGQVPRLYTREFEGRQGLPLDADPVARDRFGREFRRHWVAQGSFEGFLRDRISADFPSVFLEGFQSLRQEVAAIGLRPRTIASANAHWGNDRFKVWAAEWVARGVPFIAMEHGGCAPPAFDTMDFEEDIACAKTTWSVPYHPKHVRMPPTKVFSVRPQHRVLRGPCVVVGQELWRYAQRACAYPLGHQVLKTYDLTCTFIDNLAPTVQHAVVIKPHHDLGWNTRARYSDRYGYKRVTTLAYPALLRKARLVVCSYPNTTLTEALVRDIPTVLCYLPNFHETVPQVTPLLHAMREARMLFDDGATAAEHVSEVWGDIDRWWRSRVCRKALRLFGELACQPARRGDLLAWATFLRRLRSGES
jgi:putative transferase (TIGR04331 family)